MSGEAETIKFPLATPLPEQDLGATAKVSVGVDEARNRVAVVFEVKGTGDRDVRAVVYYDEKEAAILAHRIVESALLIKEQKAARS